MGESAEPLSNIDGFGAFPSEPSDLAVAVTTRSQSTDDFVHL